ncbi:hypothetical protein, partial [Vibrio harveyi]|uniref:hypothetical protein n=1 Tax=Vibrio harveyi TaxID=669 RepID=UPI001E4B1073
KALEAKTRESALSAKTFFIITAFICSRYATSFLAITCLSSHTLGCASLATAILRNLIRIEK